MKRKILSVRTVIILIVALGIIYFLFIVKTLVGEHGTASSISILQKVYNKAGSEVGSTFTNSLIQKFPFNGPINWKFSLFKDPFVILTGKIDTNKLHQFIVDNPSTRFFWEGVGKNGENYSEEGWPDAKTYPTTTWTNVIFRFPDLEATNVEKYSAVIDGNVDLLSNAGQLFSH